MYVRSVSLLAVISFGTLVSARGTTLSPRMRGIARSASKTYLLQDWYEGEDFFSDWTFFVDQDPTHGNVNYLNLQDARSQGLAYVDQNTAILAVDPKSNVPVGGRRDSVRITSKKSYTGGLFILDASAMPVGCGVWPSFWTKGPNWPVDGEIDIVEGVNNQAYNQMTLHTGTSKSCTLDVTGSDSTSSSAPSSKPTGSSASSSNPSSSSGTSSKPTGSSTTSDKPTGSSASSSKPTGSSTTSDKPTGSSATSDKPTSSSATSTQPTGSSAPTSKPKSSNAAFTGQVLNTDCYSTADADTGCGIRDVDPRSFGRGFNAAHGGVYALLWDPKVGISMWHFAREDIPRDITDKKPTPDKWGKPAGLWSSATCDIAANFHNHQMVIDTTICGDWAGSQGPYGDSGCPATCSAMVANASNFVDAKWVINYVAVYQ